MSEWDDLVKCCDARTKIANERLKRIGVLSAENAVLKDALKEIVRVAKDFNRKKGGKTNA